MVGSQEAPWGAVAAVNSSAAATDAFGQRSLPDIHARQLLRSPSGSALPAVLNDAAAGLEAGADGEQLLAFADPQSNAAAVKLEIGVRRDAHHREVLYTYTLQNVTQEQLRLFTEGGEGASAVLRLLLSRSTDTAAQTFLAYLRSGNSVDVVAPQGPVDRDLAALAEELPRLETAAARRSPSPYLIEALRSRVEGLSPEERREVLGQLRGDPGSVINAAREAYTRDMALLLSEQHRVGAVLLDPSEAAERRRVLRAADVAAAHGSNDETLRLPVDVVTPFGRSVFEMIGPRDAVVEAMRGPLFRAEAARGRPAPAPMMFVRPENLAAAGFAPSQASEETEDANGATPSLPPLTAPTAPSAKELEGATISPARPGGDRGEFVVGRNTGSFVDPKEEPDAGSVQTSDGLERLEKARASERADEVQAGPVRASSGPQKASTQVLVDIATRLANELPAPNDLNMADYHNFEKARLDPEYLASILAPYGLTEADVQIEVVAVRNDQTREEIHVHRQATAVTIPLGARHGYPEPENAYYFLNQYWRPASAGQVIRIGNSAPHNFTVDGQGIFYFLSVQSPPIVSESGDDDYFLLDDQTPLTEEHIRRRIVPLGEAHGTTSRQESGRRLERSRSVQRVDDMPFGALGGQTAMLLSLVSLRDCKM